MTWYFVWKGVFYNIFYTKLLSQKMGVWLQFNPYLFFKLERINFFFWIFILICLLYTLEKRKGYLIVCFKKICLSIKHIGSKIKHKIYSVKNRDENNVCQYVTKMLNPHPLNNRTIKPQYLLLPFKPPDYSNYTELISI